MKKYVKRFIKSIIKTNQLSNPASPLNGQFVNDQYCGELEYVNSSWIWKNNVRSSVTSNKDVIVVVLESPHIDEFERDGTPICPLKNDGRFIKYFPTLITDAVKANILKLCTTTTYSIYLMNAVQRQCSLGYPTEYYRDYLFMYYWTCLNNDFKIRLKNIISQKQVIAIVNLCTNGGHGKCDRIYNIYTKSYENMCKKFGKRFINRAGFIVSTKPIKYSLKYIVQTKIDKVSKCVRFHLGGDHPSSVKFGKNNLYQI